MAALINLARQCQKTTQAVNVELQGQSGDARRHDIHTGRRKAARQAKNDR